MVLRAINVFFDFFAQKISRIVTIKNWMEISDIKSGVGGGWGWGVRCLMANAIKNFHIFWEPIPYMENISTIDYIELTQLHILHILNSAFCLDASQ